MAKKVKVRDLTVKQLVEACQKRKICYGCPMFGKVCIQGEFSEIDLNKEVDLDA